MRYAERKRAYNVLYQLTAAQLVEHHSAGEKSDAGVGPAAPLVVRDHFLEADPSVGHAGRCPCLHETLGEEGPANMMFVDFQQEGRPVLRCSLGAGPVPETYSSSWSEIAPRPDGPYKQPGWDRRSGPKEGVHNVHTPGLRIGSYWFRTRPDCGGFGGAADFQGPEPGSSPTSGTCFPCSGACGPLSVHKLFTCRPLWGPFFVGGPLHWPAAPLDFRQRWRCLLVHGRELR